MISNFKDFFLKNLFFFIIFLYSLFMLGIYFFSEYINSANFTDGYIQGGDSSRYIEGGAKLSNFELPQGRSLSYIGYIFFISIFSYLKLNLTYVVIFQIFLSILSSVCLYKISKKFSSEVGGLFCILLYLFYFPLQIRNFYILTETLFICLIIFLVYLIIFFRKKNLIIIIFVALFASTIRPHGIIIVPSIFFASFIWSYKIKDKKLFLLFLIASLILVYPIYSIINETLENGAVIKSIATKGIIWGYENEKNFIKYTYQNYSKNDFFSLIIFIKENLFAFSFGVYQKLIYFFLRVRPYYSDLHNIYLIIFNLAIYPLAIFGYFKIDTKKNLGIYLIYCLILLVTISVGLTFSDWSGRFSLYILPLIFIFSGIGLDSLLKNIFYKLNKKR